VAAAGLSVSFEHAELLFAAELLLLATYRDNTENSWNCCKITSLELLDSSYIVIIANSWKTTSRAEACRE